MLLIQNIRENYEKTILGLEKRGIEDASAMMDELISKDDLRKELQSKADQLRAESKTLAKNIGQLIQKGQREVAEGFKRKVADLKKEIKSIEENHNRTVEELDELLLSVPNVPHHSVPEGKGENDNEVYRDWQSPLPVFGKDAMPHWELAQHYNLIDFGLGAKITGSGFPVYRNYGAKLQRALIHYFLDQATTAGYEEIMPPLLVNEETARATGQLPDKEGQMYYVERDNLYLIPTAEVPITNLVRDRILEEEDLPIKMCGHTPCFRREAGSYGAEVKGLNRVHQFDKIEIVQIAHPDHSYEALEEMLDHVESLLKKLELPFRILRLCGGDLGFTSALTFDFEVYSGAQKRWLEVSSVSNFETFQSNRLKLRFKNNEGKISLVHTLNGSALALARIVAAVLENNQTSEGIIVPEVLQHYMGIDIIK